MDVGEVVQRERELLRILRDRRHRQRFFDFVKAPRVIAHALEDAREVDEIAGHGILVAAFAVDGQRVFGLRQRLRNASLVPAEQSDAPQDVALERARLPAPG